MKNHLCKCLENDDFDAIRKDLGKYPSSLDSSASNDEIITYLEKNGIKRVKQNDKFKVELHVWGTGSPFREFLWAEEMADACVFLMENIDNIMLCTKCHGHEFFSFRGERNLHERNLNLIGFK